MEAPERLLIMSFADSKEIAEHALRMVRVVEKLSPPHQTQVLAVVIALINIEVQRWQFAQQTRGAVTDE